MIFLRKKSVLALAVLVLAFLLFLNSSWFEKTILYPISYKQEIQISAEHHHVDPYLVAAIIRVESNYKSHLVSKKGAVGLMQIMPDTAIWIVQKAGYSQQVLQGLDAPDINIDVGSWYLHSLSQQFENKPYAVIAAYNAGPGNVQKWLDSGVWNGTLDSMEHIPFGETRHYMRRVIYYYKKYVKLYAHDSLKKGKFELAPDQNE